MVGFVFQCDFSGVTFPHPCPSGTIIGSSSYDGTVRLWSVTGKCLKTLEGNVATARNISRAGHFIRRIWQCLESRGVDLEKNHSIKSILASNRHWDVLKRFNLSTMRHFSPGRWKAERSERSTISWRTLSNVPKYETYINRSDRSDRSSNLSEAGLWRVGYCFFSLDAYWGVKFGGHDGAVISVAFIEGWGKGWGFSKAMCAVGIASEWLWRCKLEFFCDLLCIWWCILWDLDFYFIESRIRLSAISR